MYVRKRTNNQEGIGSVIHLYRGKVETFSLPEVLDWYVRSTDIRNENDLFLRFRGNSRGRVEAVGNMQWFMQIQPLKDYCIKWSLERLTLHSGRRGWATVAMRIGMLKTSIRMCGGCLSNAMDEYFDTDTIRVDFAKRL